MDAAFSCGYSERENHGRNSVRTLLLMRFVLLGMVTILAGCASNPEHVGPPIMARPNKVSFNIKQFGAYHVQGRAQARRIPGSPDENWTSYSEHMLAFDQVTDVIPAQLRTHFGFSFEIHGLPPFATTNVLCVVSHPEMRAADGNYIRQHHWNASVRADYGGTAKSFMGYTFERASEIVPGRWIMSVVMNDEVQLRKSFTVATP